MLTRAVLPSPSLPSTRPVGARSTELVFIRTETGRFSTIIPHELRGRWLQLQMGAPELSVLTATGAPSQSPLLEVLLHDAVTIYLPVPARIFTLRSFHAASNDDRIVLSCRIVSRGMAVLQGCLFQPGRTAQALLRVLLRRQARLGCALRSELAGVTLAPVRWPTYATWATLFDSNHEQIAEERLCSERRRIWPSIAALIFHDGPAHSSALTASLASVTSAPMPVQAFTIGPNDRLPLLTTEYVALIQAGEILRPHALPVLADEAACHGQPDMLFADEDLLGPMEARRAPSFKPRAGRLSVLSGELTSGVWLVRRRWLTIIASAPRRAEAVRMEAALRLFEAGRGSACVHVPMVLTHRRSDAEQAPASVLAEVARQHQERTARPAKVRPGMSIIIPSTLKGRHVRRCLSSLLSRTPFEPLEIIIVVAQGEPLTERQKHLRRWLLTDSRVRVVTMRTREFNYSEANNFGVQHAKFGLLCLLNDDLAPVDSAWLVRIISYFDDPNVGVIGAKLVYPDRTLQHAGIVLRPDGTGEHVGKGSRRPVQSREVSAVTGACLATRRDLYERLGGLDESFASAFNDIDYCLRVRATGREVVLAADAELIHFESATYGRHYRDDETGRAEADRTRMLERWGAWFAEDPFHSPNLSRQPGAMFLPAFPPRARSLHAEPTEAVWGAVNAVDNAPPRFDRIAGKEIQSDRINQAAEAVEDSLSDALVGRAGAEQIQRRVGNQLLHILPAPLTRQAVQPGAEVAEAVDIENTAIGGG